MASNGEKNKDNIETEASDKEISDQETGTEEDSNNEDTSCDTSESSDTDSSLIYHKSAKIFKRDKQSNGKFVSFRTHTLNHWKV